jgi:hypothetical protein
MKLKPLANGIRIASAYSPHLRYRVTHSRIAFPSRVFTARYFSNTSQILAPETEVKPLETIPLDYLIKLNEEHKYSVLQKSLTTQGATGFDKIFSGCIPCK